MHQVLARVGSTGINKASRIAIGVCIAATCSIAVSGCGSSPEEVRPLSKEADLACAQVSSAANEIQVLIVKIADNNVARLLEIKQAKIYILRQDWQSLDKTALQVEATNQKITTNNIKLIDANTKLQSLTNDCRGIKEVRETYK